MDFIFEFLAEIIMEPIVEIYVFAMQSIFGKNKEIDKVKIQVFVIFECVALFTLFVVGCIKLAETNGDSLSGKIFIAASVGISVLQIIIGCVIKKKEKDAQE